MHICQVRKKAAEVLLFLYVLPLLLSRCDLLYAVTAIHEYLSFIYEAIIVANDWGEMSEIKLKSCSQMAIKAI